MAINRVINFHRIIQVKQLSVAGGEGKTLVANILRKMMDEKTRCLYSKKGSGKVTKWGYARKAFPPKAYEIAMSKYLCVILPPSPVPTHLLDPHRENVL